MLNELESLISMTYKNEQKRRKDFDTFIKLCEKLNLIYEIDESSFDSKYIYVYLNDEHYRKGNIVRNRAKQLTRGRTKDIPVHMSIDTYEIDKNFEIERDSESNVTYPKYLNMIAVAKYRFSAHNESNNEHIGNISGSLLYIDMSDDTPTNFIEIERSLKEKIKEAENRSIDLDLNGF